MNSIPFESLFFLHFGFFPKNTSPIPEAPVFPFSDQNIKPLEVLAQSVREGLGQHTEVALLLSGGLDSRILLVELLKHLPPTTIHTITYGSPGTWDYDIGNLIARKAGTQHLAIDLSIAPSVEQIQLRHRLGNSSMHPLFSIPWEQLKNIPQPIFTGFLGDWLTELPAEETQPHPNQMWMKSQVIRSWDLPHISLEGDPVSFRKFEWEWYYRKGLSHAFHPKEMTTVHPFLNEAVIQAFLSVPSSQQWEQKGYQAALLSWSPEWFKLPVKRTYGLGLHRKPWQEWWVKTSGPILRKWGIRTINRSINTAQYQDLLEQSDWRNVEEIALKKLSEWEIEAPKTFEQRLRILPLAW